VAVSVCLAPLAFIPLFLSSFGAPVSKEDEQKDALLPLSLHSITDYMGRNTTAVTPFYAWPEYEKEASRLVDGWREIVSILRRGRGERLGKRHD